MDATSTPVADFLLDLAQALHEVQLPSDEIEKHLRAIARREGVDGDFILFQSYVGAELRSGSLRQVELRRIPFDPRWKLSRLSALVALAQDVAGGRLQVADARAELARIVSRKNPYPQWAVILAYGVYSAAVAARIGGGWLELGVAALIGIIAGVVHFETIRYQGVDLQQSFLAGLLGTLAAFAGTLVLPPFDVTRALFGGMTLLVPAMVLAIATHELANDALESGTVRMAYGLLRFLMLGAGIAAAAKLWAVVFLVPPLVEPRPLPFPAVMGILVAGGAALVFCLQARRADAPWVVGAVLLAYGAQELSKRIVGEAGSPLLAAFLLGAAAYLYARRPGHFAATLMVPGLLQLAPGFLGTRSLFHLLQEEPSGSETFFRVFMVALQLVLGLLLAGILFQKRAQLPSGLPAGATGKTSV